MRLLALVLAGCFDLFRIIHSEELTVTRHSDGDIFTLEGSCKEACTVLSSGTASPYSRSSSSTAGFVALNGSCTCQCDQGLPIFREDLQICVNDIQECNVAGFLSSSGQVERVPYVFLPQRGQIIYPHAEIRFEGVATPVCGIAGAQHLGKSGWLELKNLSDAEPPFRLFRDEGRTFLQWIGEAGLRDAAEGRVVIAKLVCRDASPKVTNPSVFTPCVAFRVAGSPSKNNVREVMFSPTSQISQGLSATEYVAIGLSSVILAIIYVASVLLYLHSRRTKRKSLEEPEVTLAGARDNGGLVKTNPLLVASRHFESDTNSGLTESDLGDDLPPSDGEQGFESGQVTSAVVHPHYVYVDHSEIAFGSGSLVGERLPEEDVRVVETVDNAHQHDVPVLPGTQRRKLYFNPAYFDRQLLLAPPPAAIEFLLKIREVISIAKHKMAAKRFVPTLVGIQEEDNADSDRNGSASTNKQKQQQRAITNSAQNLAGKSKRSQRCTGCPGCIDTFRNLSTLPGGDSSNPGESKVRAWLEDVKPPQQLWQDADETRKNFQENVKTFARSLEYLKELAKRDVAASNEFNQNGRPYSAWRDNPPMLRTFHNIARSEILENEDRYSVSKRSTKSMFEESNYERHDHKRRNGFACLDLVDNNDAINAKIRKAIENSFIKQMEENTACNDEPIDEKAKAERGAKRPEEQTDDEPTEKQKTTPETKKNSTQRRKTRKSKATSPSKKLPDMIKELPGAKNTAKRIMDAVIREMVDAKVLENHSKASVAAEYEVDSLERSKCSRKSSTSPDCTDHSSPALSTALPMDEELTMQNAIIDTRTGETPSTKDAKRELLGRSYYNGLPELIDRGQRSESSYSLVSEVYVNDGYASPAGSDDSGPEIRYEPENPGHLTIKVQDSPDNYVKQDESEYEPDTLDRKPMKLKVNDDVNYERETPNEIYVDSLERPAQILLKSKGSFRDEESMRNSENERGSYGSLREIYEARLRTNLMDSNLITNGSGKSSNDESDDSASWQKTRYLTPDTRQAKRQRQPHNQPDVVPLPPTEEIYQCPGPPRRVEGPTSSPLPPTFPTSSKNAWDRSPVEAGDPTASNGTPVLNDGPNDVGNDFRASSCKLQFHSSGTFAPCGYNDEEKIRLPECNSRARVAEKERNQYPTKGSLLSAFKKQSKIEDSGYLSSTDSNGSHKRLLGHEVSSVSETDETESVCDGASESGAESIGTDSVFFGNFRRLSDVSCFSKSLDSGVELRVRNEYLRSLVARQDECLLERTNFSASDSETESFVTVLPPDGSQRNDLLS